MVGWCWMVILGSWVNPTKRVQGTPISSISTVHEHVYTMSPKLKWLINHHVTRWKWQFQGVPPLLDTPFFWHEIRGEIHNHSYDQPQRGKWPDIIDNWAHTQPFFVDTTTRSWWIEAAQLFHVPEQLQCTMKPTILRVAENLIFHSPWWTMMNHVKAYVVRSWFWLVGGLKMIEILFISNPRNRIFLGGWSLFNFLCFTAQPPAASAAWIVSEEGSSIVVRAVLRETWTLSHAVARCRQGPWWNMVEPRWGKTWD